MNYLERVKSKITLVLLRCTLFRLQFLTDPLSLALVLDTSITISFSIQMCRRPCRQPKGLLGYWVCWLLSETWAVMGRDCHPLDCLRQP